MQKIVRIYGDATERSGPGELPSVRVLRAESPLGQDAGDRASSPGRFRLQDHPANGPQSQRRNTRSWAAAEGRRVL